MSDATVAKPAWYDQYAQKHWFDQLKKRFQHRFEYRFGDPEDAFATAIETLLLKKLPNAQLQHMDNTDAFVRVCFDRTVIDICRSVNGRIQAPLRLRSKGAAHIELFFRHCLGKINAKDISRVVELPLACVRHWIHWLDNERICDRCKPAVHQSISDDVGESLALSDYQEGQGSSVERELEFAERHALVSHLLRACGAEHNEQGMDMPAPGLSDEQFLVLKMHYWEEITLVAIAQHMGKPEHRIKYLHRTAIARLRKVIREYSIDVQ